MSVPCKLFTLPISLIIAKRILGHLDSRWKVKLLSFIRLSWRATSTFIRRISTWTSWQNIFIKMERKSRFSWYNTQKEGEETHPYLITSFLVLLFAICSLFDWTTCYMIDWLIVKCWPIYSFVCHVCLQRPTRGWSPRPTASPSRTFTSLRNMDLNNQREYFC